MTPQYVITAAQWGMNFAFWSAITFAAFAGVVWPWWKSSWGINIISLEIAIALALFEPVLQVDFGVNITSSVVFAWVGVFALWLVGVISVWRGALVISAQVKGRRQAQRNREVTKKVDCDQH